MDVWAYVAERRRECDELSLGNVEVHVAAELGEGDRRGRVIGTAYLREHAYVRFHEIVIIEGEHIHREKYAYYLTVDGREIGGYERDPTHPVPEHRHCSHRDGHGPGQPCDRISFKDAVAEAWEWLSRPSVSGEPLARPE